MKLSEILKKLKENPEDLAPLVDAIAQAETLEKSEETLANQLGQAQINYRKLLQLVPTPGEEQKEEPQEKVYTVDDAVEEIKKQMGGITE